jgi:hypothetical protein
MNVKLLRKIQKHILEEPRRLNMDGWGMVFDMEDAAIDKRVPPCGTAGCIAGTACIITGAIKPSRIIGRTYRNTYTGGRPFWEFPDNTPDKARKALGLKKEQAQRLFYMPDHIWSDIDLHWPKRFGTAYRKAKTPRGKARVTSRRIDHFIKTKGAE